MCPSYFGSLASGGSIWKGPHRSGEGSCRSDAGNPGGAAAVKYWSPGLAGRLLPRRPLSSPRPFDSPETARQLGGAAAERSRRAEPPGQLEQVTARAACPSWGLPGSWSKQRRRPHLTRAGGWGGGARAATPPTGRAMPPPLRAGAGPERRPLLQPPWEPRARAAGPEFSTAGAWAATLSAAGMHWRPPSHFPEESPKGRSGAWLGRRLPGPASEGAARLLPSAVPSRSEVRPRTLVLRRG